jgi:hypothetical protein
VKTIVRSTLVLALVGGLGAIVALLVGVDRTDLVLDAYLVYLAALAALAAARIANGAFPAPRGIVGRVLARPPRRQARPESLAAVADDVALAQADQFDLHFRLRPMLADIADAGLAARYGADLRERSERARAVLSPETWEIVRPHRPRPPSAGLRGIDTKSLAAVIGELERILPP